jgi:hypothetical protein
VIRGTMPELRTRHSIGFDVVHGKASLVDGLFDTLVQVVELPQDLFLTVFEIEKQRRAARRDVGRGFE